MENFKVFHSDEFDRQLSKFDKIFQDRLDKVEGKLSINPCYGNQLGIRSFRETRLGTYRFYYIIYEDLKSIYMVAISDKKDQQKVINTIRLFFDVFREEVLELIYKEKDDTT